MSRLALKTHSVGPCLLDFTLRLSLNNMSATPPLSNLTLQDLCRVNIVGTSGSGKSTFARRLALLLDVPYIEMDQLYHGPNWTEPEPEVFRERLEQALTGEQWVLDGNYHSKTYDVKWPKTQTVVWLDPSFALNLWQAVTRAIHRAWTKKELWPGTGNRETFRKSFLSRESVVLWTITSYYRLQHRYGAVQQNPPYEHLKFVRLKGRSAAEQFLNQVEELAVSS